MIFGSIVLALLLSFSPTDLSGVPSDASSIPIMVLFSLILTFLLDDAIKKDQELRQSVNIELSRLRRVYHLAEIMGDRAWSKKVSHAIKEYLSYFGRNSFSFYDGAQEPFRQLTHSVYAFSPKSRKEEIVFEELLHTTRDLATMRQKVSSFMQNKISLFGWAVLLSVEAFVVISIMITKGVSEFSNTVSTAVLASIFIVTLLIREVDTYYSDELESLANRYVQNIDKLDPGHHRQKTKKR